MKTKSKIVLVSLVIALSLTLYRPTSSAQMKSNDPKQTAGSAVTNNGTQMPDIWDVFHNRRSVRKFKSDAVPEAYIRQIIDAALMAPTSGNQQPLKFLVDGPLAAGYLTFVTEF